jgi:hypothetical protein
MSKRLETRWQATEQVLALVVRTRRALAKINETCAHAKGVFQHPETQVAMLKAVRDHIDEAIAIIQARYKEVARPRAANERKFSQLTEPGDNH